MNFLCASEKDPLRVIVLIAVVIYVITAINSHGYYYADEHYQIIEFAGAKLGTHAPSELAWEYSAKMRPALQPIICFLLFRIGDVLGISDPYAQAFMLRLISALFSIFVITYFILKTREGIDGESNKRIYYLISFFLWFIPFLSVRFSSETWSGLVFLLALAVYESKSKGVSRPYVIGMLLGLSFLFRFQMAFALVGFGLWLILISPYRLKFLLKVLSSFIAIMFLGFLLDSWFYQEIVCTPWNYFYQNIVEGAASDFGTSPWYYYFSKLLSYPSYFIGVPLALSLIVLIVTRPRNYLLWCILSFFIAHSLISHKEERFLFPLVFLFPLILMMSYQIINKFIGDHVCLRVIKVIFLIIFGAVNSIGLIAMGQKSAGIGRMEITKHIHDNYGQEPVNLIFCAWANPYDPWHSLPSKFYVEELLTNRRIDDLCGLSDSLFVPDAVNLLVIRKLDKAHADCAVRMDDFDFVLDKQSVPNWIVLVNSEYKGLDSLNLLELYKLNSTVE